MKHLIKYTWSIVTVLALAACVKETAQEEVVPEDLNEGKELISFGEDKGPVTRAFFNENKQGFSAETKVYMRIKATDGTNTRYAEATATATGNKPASGEGADDHSTLVGAHSDLGYDDGQERYWDDAFGRASRLTVYAFAIPNRTNAPLPEWAKTTWVQVNATTNKNWYTAGADDVTVSWSVSTEQSSETMDKEDLAYSNNISDGGTGGRYTHAYSPAYADEEGEGAFPKTLQDPTVIGDGQMRWWPKTIASKAEKDAHSFAVTTGKFDQGHLIFNHALAWIEINLKEGAGFNNGVDTDFKWSKDKTFTGVTQNITLKSFNTGGTLNVSTGGWSSQTSSNITTMDEHSVSGNATTRQLYAFVVPGNNLYETTSNVVEFEIDEGKYYVSGKKIAEAIQEYYTTGAGKDLTEASTYKNFTTIESGKHYVINLTVAKKGIDRITAAILPWETVNSSDADAKNTYPTFNLEDYYSKLEGDAGAKQFNLYRAAWTATDYITSNTTQDYDHWTTGYGNTPADKLWNSTKSEWSTNWFWENNRTAYHFRAAGYADNASGTPSVTIQKDETPDPDVDYFAITSGEISGSTYKDYIWGAPFKDISGALTYDAATYGFDGTSAHQISYAIGSTESVIRMLLFHMTSQVFVNVRTTTDASKVTLDTDGDNTTNTDKTKVEILRFLADGRVLMGNGLVQTTTAEVSRTGAVDMTYGTYSAAASSEPDKVTGYSYGIVPQSLTYTGGTVGLRITTPDGNQYVVQDLSTCKGTVSGNNISVVYADAGSGLKTINRWYPSHQYTYTITIKKTGIERITAAVVPWETVTGDLGTIDLEN